MFEKFITNIKQSLPGGAAKNAGSNNPENGAGAALGKKQVNVQVAMAAAASAEESAKKRNSMIVKVIVILGMAYLAVDEFLLKEQAPVEIVDVKPKKPKKKKEETQAVADAKPAEAAEASSAPADQSSSESSPPPIENVNVINKDNTPVAEETPAPTPAPAINESRVGEVNLDQKIDQIVQKVDQNQIQNQAVEEIKIPSQPQNSVTGTPTPSEEAQKDPQRDTTSMASKIVEEATESAPPAYDQLGRGLVYNCKDKYWACLNKPAYLECNKNMKWNQSQGKPAECVVQDIYNSDEDCAKIQKYNVTVSTATAFCN